MAATQQQQHSLHHCLSAPRLSTYRLFTRCLLVSISVASSLTSTTTATNSRSLTMDYLSYWLLLVASMRTLSVFLGYRNPRYFQEQLFTTSTSQVTPLASRNFAIWTLLSCTVAAIAAFHLHERGAYLAAMLSFYVAAGYFTLELLVFGTVKLKDRFVVMAFAIASQSIHTRHAATVSGLGWDQQSRPLCCLLTLSLHLLIRVCVLSVSVVISASWMTAQYTAYHRKFW